MTPRPSDLRLAGARRDLSVTLASLGAGFVLAGLVLACAPLAAGVGSSARGPELLVRAGVVVGGLCLAAFSGALVVRVRRGWRGSLFACAAPGAVGVGSLIGLDVLALLVSGGRDHRGLIVSGLVASGAAIAGIAAGVSGGRPWARPALAGLAALVSSALLWGAMELYRSNELVLPLLVVLCATPALLVLASLCLPGGAALFCGVVGWARAVPRGPSRLLFRAGAGLSIGLFALLWLASVVLVAPNVAHAIHRTRQRRTMGELRTVMTVVESYAVDKGTYPAATTIDELASLLEPTYVGHLPRRDGWGWPLDYRSRSPGSTDGTGSGGKVTAEHYVVRSPGRDGLFEHADPFACEGGPTNGFDRDIVFASSTPSQWPEGTMRP